LSDISATVFIKILAFNIHLVVLNLRFINLLKQNRVKIEGLIKRNKDCVKNVVKTKELDLVMSLEKDVVGTSGKKVVNAVKDVQEGE
jgi:hypothetical protein